MEGFDSQSYVPCTVVDAGPICGEVLLLSELPLPARQHPPLLILSHADTVCFVATSSSNFFL